MKKFAKGKAWKFGDDLSMDKDIFPFQYILELSRDVPLEKLANHLMEPVNPDFGKNVRKGDFLVAGRNFGHGKSHSEGAGAMKALGLSAVIADSIAPGFFSKTVYCALPVLTGDDVSKKIEQGDELEINIETGEIRNLSTGETFHANPAVPPGHPLYPIMEAGGQIEYIKQKVACTKKT